MPMRNFSPESNSRLTPAHRQNKMAIVKLIHKGAALEKRIEELRAELRQGELKQYLACHSETGAKMATETVFDPFNYDHVGDGIFYDNDADMAFLVGDGEYRDWKRAK